MPDESQSLHFSPEAEWAFARHVADVEAGRGKGFDAFCAEHPELAEELRGLRAQWEQDAGVLHQLLREPTTQDLQSKPSRVSGPCPDGHPQAGQDLLHQLAEHSPPASRYELRGEFARGGMGVILKVWDADLRRELAMKVILAKGERPLGSTPAVDERSLGRFLEEAQVTGQLDHPGVVPVHELGLDSSGRIYFTMRLVKGRNLGEVLELVRQRKDGWTRTRVLGVLLKVCEAMAYAHSKGVVHRDLKPSNVMVGRFGEVYVMDWGLARVIGRKDAHDLRLAAPVATRSLRTTRSERLAETPDSPIITMDGTVVGTPSYMPPEQAEGRVEELGPSADVYSVGAILYELLTRQKPYVRAGAQPSPHTILAALLNGPPTPVEELAKDVPAELVAICERAMSREPAQRYADMAALSEDMSAYLEHRVVTAYRTGAVAELKKWVERNKGLAAAIAGVFVAVILGMVVSLAFKARSDHNARAAKASEERAQTEKTRAEKSETIALVERKRAEERRDEVLRFTDLVDLDDLEQQTDQLWPVRPAFLPDYEDWIARGRALLEKLPAYRKTLAELRTRALARSEEERQTERAKHPEWKQLRALEGELSFRSRALFNRRDGLAVVLPEVEWSRYPEEVLLLNDIAWAKVEPERTSFGEEPLALAIARRAMERAGQEEKFIIGDTLAWALFAVGDDDEAIAASKAALAAAPEARKTEFEAYLSKLENEVNKAASSESLRSEEARIIELKSRVEELDARVDERREWHFSTKQDQLWNKQLSWLVERLEALEVGLLAPEAVTHGHGWSIPKRLALAERLRDGFAPGGELERAWNHDLPEICKAYGGLDISPQMGLVPIGPDPASGLWEFGEFSTGEVPSRRDGRLEMKEETGLVFVLLPGGTFLMGSQKRSPDAPNFDPESTDDETPVRKVRLSPFFLSKYEMTQAQWQRLTGAEPSNYSNRNWNSSWNRDETRPLLTHPVEMVSWSECARQCQRLGFALPGEAQWEYAVRGGTTEPWWFGADPAALETAGNVADRQAAKFSRGDARWDDGALVHMPVDAQDLNPFGFFGMLGNVWEWCADGYYLDTYSNPLLGSDPVASPNNAGIRVRRGGAYLSSHADTRSANRGNDNQETAVAECGLRPARALEVP